MHGLIPSKRRNCGGAPIHKSLGSAQLPPSCRHNRSVCLVVPEVQTAQRGVGMVLVLEINFALWVMIGCLAREAFQLAM
jgi:hypothetical protein